MDLGRKSVGLILAAGSVIPMVATSSDEVIEVYPNRPIRLVVGFPPGGGADAIARHMATAMTEELGQRVVIENRPGAAGNIGAAAVAKAEPDGYTIYLASRPVALHKSMYKDIEYDFAKDLIPVGMVTSVPLLLVAGKHLAVSSFEQAMTLIRKEPEKFTCGSVGLGSTTHLLLEQLKESAGIALMHVPYKGASAALLGVSSATTDFAIVSVPSALPYIASGAVRALAVFSEGKVPAVAAVPSIKTVGVLDVEAEGWLAIVAPTGTPLHAVTRLNHAINIAISSPGVRKAMLDSGYLSPSSKNTPEMLEGFIEADTRKWATVLEVQQIKGLR